MPIPFTTDAQPRAQVLTGGVEAQATPADLRLSLNISKFRSGLMHLAGSASMAALSVVVTVGLIGTAFVKGQFAAVIFAGFTAITAYWMTVYSLAAANALINFYRRAISCAEEANRQNAILRKQNLRLVTERSRREEGERTGSGGEVASPSASIYRMLQHKGPVQ